MVNETVCFDVLRLSHEGRTIKEIATELQLSMSSVYDARCQLRRAKLDLPPLPGHWAPELDGPPCGRCGLRAEHECLGDAVSFLRRQQEDY